MPRIVFAADSVSVGDFRNRLRLRKGDPYWADSVEVRTHPDLFTDEPDERAVKGTRLAQPEVEQATAAPGEKRAVRRGG